MHLRKLQVDPSIRLDSIATLSNGLCGADLAALVNEAAIRAVRRGGLNVTQIDLQDALNNYFTSRGGLAPVQPPNISEVATDIWKKIGFGSDDSSKPLTAGT